MKICVVGLGYVGLPLAVAFGKKKPIAGYDINSQRIADLKKGIDSTREVSAKELLEARIEFSDDPGIIAKSNFIIIAVPTPVDRAKQPDFAAVKSATVLVGKHMQTGSIVVYESTVYPGATEEICTPILEKESSLTFGKDFHLGYSPERINPGDKVHTVDKIVKIVSGSDPQTLEAIAKEYSLIISAGLFKASSIQVAEAAKVIENIQRDINIALMNELKMIFDKKGIDVNEVIAAASTKWNFMHFTPGLVGGHCIGIDPYYLAYEAERIGHYPEIILAGRRINDAMPKYVAQKIMKKIDRGKILLLGATFKPNITDVRNSKVQDLAQELKAYGCDVAVSDPHIEAREIFGLNNYSVDEAIKKGYTTAIYAVKHAEFQNNLENLKKKFKVFLEIF